MKRITNWTKRQYGVIFSNPCKAVDLPGYDTAQETAEKQYGDNFELAPEGEKDENGHKVIGRWKPNTEKEYRRRWNGTKYVYEAK